MTKAEALRHAEVLESISSTCAGSGRAIYSSTSQCHTSVKAAAQLLRTVAEAEPVAEVYFAANVSQARMILPSKDATPGMLLYRSPLEAEE